MIFVPRQKIPDEPSCTTFYQRLVAPKQNPEPKLRALRGSYADTTIVSIHLLVANSNERRRYEGDWFYKAMMRNSAYGNTKNQHDGAEASHRRLQQPRKAVNEVGSFLVGTAGTKTQLH